MYYWDSYWTIQGLLVSEMYDTVKGIKDWLSRVKIDDFPNVFLGMLQNFVQLIQAVGHIPNGNRIYYTRRTQPPLFISMVEAYYEVNCIVVYIKVLQAYITKVKFLAGGYLPPLWHFGRGGVHPQKKFLEGGYWGGVPNSEIFLGIFLPEFFFLLNKNSFSRASRAKIFFCGLSQRGGTQPLGFAQRGGKDPPSGFF